MSLDEIFQMNFDLENINNNFSQENFTPVFDDDDSLSIAIEEHEQHSEEQKQCSLK
ncbi:15121_t:CDS:2 [Dentiscutata erythropus]|uniref:15121_t:CDS:1 n=1 Tax=Dentiscutata erythropus TaxID=1348616 RepID=A0A9N9K4E5_9GLOM|nr:15121_t:CDS:2 [Dentiscutata erythropus]